jgi:hypothetical protein
MSSDFDINFSRFIDLCETEDEKGIVEWLESNAEKLDDSLNGYLFLIKPEFSYVMEYMENNKKFSETLDVFYAHNKMYSKIKHVSTNCAQVCIDNEDFTLLNVLIDMGYKFDVYSKNYNKCSVNFVSKIWELITGNYDKGYLLGLLVEHDPTPEQINFFLEHIGMLNPNEMFTIDNKKMCDLMLDRGLVNDRFDVPFCSDYSEFHRFMSKYLATGNKLTIHRNKLYCYKYYYENNLTKDDLTNPEHFDIAIFRYDYSYAYKYENVHEIIECLECLPKDMLIRALSKLPSNFVYIDYEKLNSIYRELRVSELVLDLSKLFCEEKAFICYIIDQLNIRYNAQIRYIYRAE